MRTVNFKLTYADLAFESKSKANAALRDINELIQVGITEQFLTEFSADIATLESFNIDEELVGLQAIVTREKNEVSDQLQRQIRITMSVITNVYSKQSAEYTRFMPNAISTYTNSDLNRQAHSVIRQLHDMFPDLAPFGFTEQNVTELAQLNDRFYELLEEQANAIRNRDIETQKRQDLAEIVYVKLTRLCSAAKTVWFGVDEARYNDFIIYRSKAKEENADVEVVPDVEQTPSYN